jgi:hypothetical protein
MAFNRSSRFHPDYCVDPKRSNRKSQAWHHLYLVSHHRIKTVTKRINYSGPAASIKIMKGVRWRVGSIAVQRMTTDVMTQLDNGSLYVTSARLFFDGEKKNTSIPLGKITNFTVFKDELQIEKETGPDEYFLGWLRLGTCRWMPRRRCK